MHSAGSLRGFVVAITGGARGIGLATARSCQSAGARVVIGDIDEALVKRVAEEHGMLGLGLDVRIPAAFADFVACAEAALGPLDVLVNNAGIMPMGVFHEESQSMSDAQIDINLRGVIHGMKAVLPGMLARGRGHVVNVASLAGRLGIPGAAVYSATKFAVVGLTEAADAEYRGQGVRFSVVLPSKVRTELASGTERAGRGVPAVEPKDVADSIVQALQRPRLHVTVPAFLGPVVALQAIAPTRVVQLVRTTLDDSRILRQLDHDERSSYVRRVESLVRK